MDSQGFSGLLERLRAELGLRNYSRKTVESYCHSVRLFLDFAGKHKKGGEPSG